MFRWPWAKKTEQRAISYQDVWGSGRDVSAVNGSSINTALTLAPVWAAVRLISDSIAALPLQAYRRTTEDLRQPIKTPNVLANPTIYGTSHEWVQRGLSSLLLRGNAFGLVTSTDANGWPQQVEWLHPDDVTLKDNRATTRPEWLWNGRPVDPYLGRDSAGQLLHIPWFVIPGEILGLSPIGAFATTIESGILAGRFGRDFFGSDAIPVAVLETDQAVSQEQAELVKSRFRYAASRRDPVVLGAGTTYKPITVPPEESQFLETIKATATQIAAIYGVRPERVGGESGNSMTYANVENQAMADLQDMRPYITKLEIHFSGLLPRPQYARFNFDSLLRADLKSRYEAYAIGIGAKFLTPDEARETEDRPPLTDEQKADLSPKPAITSNPEPTDVPAATVVSLRPAANE